LAAVLRALAHEAIARRMVTFAGPFMHVKLPLREIHVLLLRLIESSFEITPDLRVAVSVPIYKKVHVVLMFHSLELAEVALPCKS
jgi:hypothetical protein